MFTFQLIILYSSLFFEAVRVNLKLVDLKEEARKLGLNDTDDILDEEPIKSITF